MLRTHEAGLLSKSDVGTEVVLAGWVARRRDHGGVAFIDLRDASGAVQVVIKDEIAGALRAEWCVLITGKVRASLVDAKDLFATAFKIVTERGTVHIMGRVTQREANRAADIARGVDGVKKVVRIVEIISEEELQSLTTK